jgi:hypothetical protein
LSRIEAGFYFAFFLDLCHKPLCDRGVQMKQPKGLDLLREPFPKHQISLLPKPTKKDNPKGKCPECGGWHGLPAVHLEYVGHAALTDRLLEADPEWTWEPLALHEGLPAFDKSGGLWIKLTVCGVTRLGYGHAENSSFKEIGAREKEVIGDALRNAAMRFGAALDLWHKGDLHGDDDDPTPPPQKPTTSHNVPPKTVKNTTQPALGTPVSEAQLKRMFAISHEAGWTHEQIKLYMAAAWGLESSKDLDRVKYDRLIEVMQSGPYVKAITGLGGLSG